MGPLTEENYVDTVLIFRERQAGVSVIYDAERDGWSYNAYCLETKLLKELFTFEYEFLNDALETINSEFGHWQVEKLGETSGCGTCVAKC